MGKSQKNYMSIKSKLMAAVAMLLVASFMVVSSTYAWFTLSTAPEVTGIQTKIGANGSLEMALLYYNHKTDAVVAEGGESNDFDESGVSLISLAGKVVAGVGSSVAYTNDAFISNKTWGNIVDLDLEEYGLNDVTLLPSSLHATKDGEAVRLVTGSPLYTPTYGADGRIETLQANTLARLYHESAYSAEGYGVRVLGTASGMAAHEMGYTNAKANASSSLRKARNYAGDALKGVSNTLATIAMGEALNKGASTYDISGLTQVFEDLNTANQGILEAIRYYLEAEIAGEIVALGTDEMPVTQAYSAAVSKLNSLDETALLAMAKNSTTIEGTLGEETVSVTLGGNATLSALADQYTAIKNQIASAKATYDLIGSKTAASVQNAKNVVYALVPSNEVYLYDQPLSYWTGLGDGAQGAIMTEAQNNNFSAKLTIDNGENVFAKFAVAGNDNIATKFTMNASAIVNGLTNVPTTIATILEASEFTINLMADFPDEPEADANAEKVLSDYYGYGIDLAFRTNAANSNLCLQIDPTGRIYSEGAESTMGQGSNMTFNVDYTAWGITVDPANAGANKAIFATDEEAYAYAAKLVARLADAIRIVFTDGTDKIVSFAKPAVPLTDAAAGVTVANINLGDTFNAETKTLKLPIKLYDVEVTTDKVVVKAADDVAGTPEISYDPGLRFTGNWTEKESLDDKNAQILMPLNQNEAAALSVTVYLDGNVVDNSMVASDGKISMGGKLNLQFSSDADLTPMSYTPLQQGGGSTESGS